MPACEKYVLSTETNYRINLLEGDDALVDEEFWKMGQFQDEEDDVEYESEAGMLGSCLPDR